jgi:hypothetical protein
MAIRIVAVALCAVVAACQSTAPVPGDGASVMPHPVSYYECADGTKLDVRLTGDSALIRVNGSDEIQLPQLTSSGNKSVYTNGKQTVEIAGGTLSFGLGRAVPVTCKGA